jgi:hypothetical protein
MLGCGLNGWPGAEGKAVAEVGRQQIAASSSADGVTGALLFCLKRAQVARVTGAGRQAVWSRACSAEQSRAELAGENNFAAAAATVSTSSSECARAGSDGGRTGGGLHVSYSGREIWCA